MIQHCKVTLDEPTTQGHLNDHKGQDDSKRNVLLNVSDDLVFVLIDDQVFILAINGLSRQRGSKLSTYILYNCFLMILKWF